ncbi:hypothetical protein N7533_000722 [Penicillium manginii]|uniref:uncharacterized protein n=1 Tax=Penicillium manginii TaxID=203109 RepID=UPI002548C1DC|nr:uncharacterized protein N7533_000722 [Penicillium manginii]KAJ5768139.1 hypothetical protein N7533_000722 [Penicillium manginii]
MAPEIDLTWSFPRLANFEHIFELKPNGLIPTHPRLLEECLTTFNSHNHIFGLADVYFAIHLIEYAGGDDWGFTLESDYARNIYIAMEICTMVQEIDIESLSSGKIAHNLKKKVYFRSSDREEFRECILEACVPWRDARGSVVEWGIEFRFPDPPVERRRGDLRVLSEYFAMSNPKLFEMV